MVDDVEANRMLATAMLAHLGFDAEEAPDGNAALEIFRPGRFDVVLMDCQMPVLDGYAATAEIRRREGRGPRTPIIAVTATAAADHAEHAVAAGMDMHVPKPLGLESLRAALEAVLHDSGGAEEVDTTGRVLDPARRSELRRFDPDGSGLRELADLFVEDAPQRLEAISASASAADLEGVRQQAHALRGSALLAGAERFALLLAEVEQQARSGGGPDPQRLAALEEAYRDAAAALRDERP